MPLCTSVLKKGCTVGKYDVNRSGNIIRHMTGKCEASCPQGDTVYILYGDHMG